MRQPERGLLHILGLWAWKGLCPGSFAWFYDGRLGGMVRLQAGTHMDLSAAHPALFVSLMKQEGDFHSRYECLSRPGNKYRASRVFIPVMNGRIPE